MRIRHLLMLLSLIVVAGCDDDAPGSSNPLVGTSQDFEVETLQSANLKATLKQFHGKPVLIDFWATWCGPCHALKPVVESLYSKYRDKGLETMAISQESRKDIQKYESNDPHKMPVYVDEYGVANNTFKVDALPTIVLIGKDGKVSFYAVGIPDGHLDQYAAQLDQLVAKAL